MLQVCRGGEQRGEVDGSPLVVGEDRIVLQDTALPYHAVARTEDNIGVVIPRHRILGHERFHRRMPLLAWPLASPTGRILHQTLTSVMETLPALPRENAPTVASSFVGLVNGLLSAEPLSDLDDNANEHVKEASLAAMKAYLVRNLRDLELSPDVLSKTFACSRAKVRRLATSPNHRYRPWDPPLSYS